ncbi:MAG: hypothetical protein EZS28_036644, partial [Streblomastix strix]
MNKEGQTKSQNSPKKKLSGNQANLAPVLNSHSQQQQGHNSYSGINSTKKPKSAKNSIGSQNSGEKESQNYDKKSNSSDHTSLNSQSPSTVSSQVASQNNQSLSIQNLKKNFTPQQSPRKKNSNNIQISPKKDRIIEIKDKNNEKEKEKEKEQKDDKIEKIKIKDNQKVGLNLIDNFNLKDSPQKSPRNQINNIQPSSPKSVAQQAAGQKKFNIPSFPSNIPIFSQVLTSSNYAQHPLISPRYSYNIKDNHKNNNSNNNNNDAVSKGSSLARGTKRDLRDSTGQKIQRIHKVHKDNIQDKTGDLQIDKVQQQSKDGSNPPGSAEKQTRVLIDTSKMSERLEKIDREREQNQQKIKSSKDRSTLPGQSNQTHAISPSSKSRPITAASAATYQQIRQASSPTSQQQY